MVFYKQEVDKIMNVLDMKISKTEMRNIIDNILSDLIKEMSWF